MTKRKQPEINFDEPLPTWADDLIADYATAFPEDPDWSAKYCDGMEAGIRLVLDRIKATTKGDQALKYERRLSEATRAQAEERNRNREEIRKAILGD